MPVRGPFTFGVLSMDPTDGGNVKMRGGVTEGEKVIDRPGDRG